MGILDFAVKVVDALLWPWQCAFLFGLYAFSSAVSLFLWLALAPIRLLSSPTSQKQELVKELNQLRIVVEELEEKANLERRERVALYGKLEKALQQRALLKSRVAALSKEVRDLKDINSHVEEEMTNLHEAKVAANADVIRASLVVEEYERRLQEVAGVGLQPGVLDEKLYAVKDLEPDEVVYEAEKRASTLLSTTHATTVAGASGPYPSVCPHSTSLLLFAGLCTMLAGSLALAGWYFEQKRSVVLALSCDFLMAVFTSRWLSDTKATAWGWGSFPEFVMAGAGACWVRSLRNAVG